VLYEEIAKIVDTLDLFLLAKSGQGCCAPLSPKVAMLITPRKLRSLPMLMHAVLRSRLSFHAATY